MPTITDLATTNPEFSILAGLVVLNDTNTASSTLLETLSDPTANVGLYAPTNAAFLDLALSFGYLGDITDNTAIATFLYAGLGTLGDPDALLEAILTYHLAATPPALVVGDTITDGDAQNPDATVQAVSLADNGTVFIIDTVLLPIEVPLNDTPTPSMYDDTLVGTTGDDFIDLLAGKDSYFGDAGNDSISGNLGNDKIDGGQDDDTIFLGGGNDNGWGGEGNDSVYGGTGSDRVNGNSGDDLLVGGSGGDIIRGGKGEDKILGGGQADQIYGGSQADEIFGGTGNDIIYGDEGKDTIHAGDNDDYVEGGIMDDTIYGDHGKDELYGGDGNDSIDGGISDDTIYGDDGRDILEGGRGGDRLYGGADNDELYGGAQGDILNGGSGDDLLVGGLGHDQMAGNTGADEFVFADTFNNDTIVDFGNGDDMITLDASLGLIMSAETLLARHATEVDGDTVINLGGNGSITLTGVSLDDLSADDFNIEFAVLVSNVL